MGNKRMTVLVLLTSLMTAGSVFAYYGEHDMLQEMVSKADSIAVIKVTGFTIGPNLHLAGIEEWSATCHVVESVKGELKTDQKFTISGNRVVGAGERALPLAEGKQYVVFLQAHRGDGSVPFRLLDRWVGAIPFDTYLVEVVKGLVKKQKELEQKK